MGENPSIEDVMERIRARVEQRSGRSALSAVRTSPNEDEEPGSVVANIDEGTVSRFEIQANDLSPLKGEIKIALDGTHHVGQINPRGPGLHNQIIQFVKKIMRRSLTWYTRPLHYFQGGAIRALQRTQVLLESHEQSFQAVSEQVNYHATVIRQQSAVIEQTAEDLASRISSQATVIRQQSAVIEQTAEDLASRISSQGQALEQTATGIDLQRREIANLLAVSGQRTAEMLSSLDRRNAEVSADLNAKLALAQSTGEAKIDQMRTSHERQISSMADDIVKLQSRIEELSEGQRRNQLQGRLRDRDFRRFVHDVRSGEVGASARQAVASVPPMFPSDIRHEREFDYFAFEDRYRGDEALIRRRQEEYLTYFQGRENVLDVGCGRGEFLELLRENSITAKGVESGTDQYLICKTKGLEVVQQDLFSYLESLPDESLGGLFSAQVIEHLTASDQLRYVALAHRKTSPGSPVIFETINAQCVWAVMRNFFLDPTHVRPVHPETLKFAMESANFQNVALLFSSPVTDHQIPPLEVDGEARNLEAFNRQLAHLNELLYGNQDYAAIGWR